MEHSLTYALYVQLPISFPSQHSVIFLHLLSLTFSPLPDENHEYRDWSVLFISMIPEASDNAWHKKMLNNYCLMNENMNLGKYNDTYHYLKNLTS